MGRRWIAVERSLDTIATYALPRLTKVVQGQDIGGVSEVTEWEGGGGFRVIDVAPSMFEVDEGVVVLADWATNGALAEATAAQMGFDYEPVAPFCGRKGRTRLTVVDGLVNEAVVRLLVQALADDERLVVCGTAIDTEARNILRSLRPGSAIRRIPGAILDDYRARAREENRLIESDVAETPRREGRDPQTASPEGGN
jgi:adenine-specific DNA-methyltransferase